MAGPGNAFRDHSEVNQLDGVEDFLNRRNRLRKFVATRQGGAKVGLPLFIWKIIQ